MSWQRVVVVPFRVVAKGILSDDYQTESGPGHVDSDSRQDYQPQKCYLGHENGIDSQ